MTQYSGILYVRAVRSFSRVDQPLATISKALSIQFFRGCEHRKIFQTSFTVTRSALVSSYDTHLQLATTTKHDCHWLCRDFSACVQTIDVSLICAWLADCMSRHTLQFISFCSLKQRPKCGPAITGQTRLVLTALYVYGIYKMSTESVRTLQKIVACTMTCNYF